MAKKRILEFATYAGIGGTQRMLAEFFRHASHDRFQYSLCVLLQPGYLTEQAEALNIEHISLNMRGYWDVTAWGKLYRFAKRKRFDLIRTYGLKAHIIGRIVGKLLGIPVNISSVRSTDPWRKWQHVWLDRVTSGLTDLYIANSEAGRLITHQREKIPLSKIITIPNGIDLASFPSPHATLCQQVRKEFGIPPNAPVIGIIANFRQMKGHRTLVDALPRIQVQFPEIICLFVGEKFVNEPWYQQELQAYIREKNLDERIIFTGMRRDIPDILAAFDLFLLPSWWEGLPVTLLEAMAMKRPVIATTVGGIPEIVEDHATGLLIPPQDHQALADAVIYLLKHPAHAEKMGQAGYERVQRHFSIQTVVTHTEAVYSSLTR